METKENKYEILGSDIFFVICFGIPKKSITFAHLKSSSRKMWFWHKSSSRKV